MKNRVNPFSSEDKKAIEDAIASIDDLQQEIVKAKNCGIDCEEKIKRLTANRKRLSSFLTQYWPSEV